MRSRERKLVTYISKFCSFIIANKQTNARLKRALIVNLFFFIVGEHSNGSVGNMYIREEKGQTGREGKPEIKMRAERKRKRKRTEKERSEKIKALAIK